MIKKTNDLKQNLHNALFIFCDMLDFIKEKFLKLKIVKLFYKGDNTQSVRRNDDKKIKVAIAILIIVLIAFVCSINKAMKTPLHLSTRNINVVTLINNMDESSSKLMEIDKKEDISKIIKCLNAIEKDNNKNNNKDLNNPNIADTKIDNDPFRIYEEELNEIINNTNNVDDIYDLTVIINYKNKSKEINIKNNVLTYKNKETKIKTNLLNNMWYQLNYKVVDKTLENIETIKE